MDEPPSGMLGAVHHLSTSVAVLTGGISKEKLMQRLGGSVRTAAIAAEQGIAESAKV
jgi:hypothetical protein